MPSISMQRRDYVMGIGGGAVGMMAGCIAGITDEEEGMEIHFLEPEGALSIPVMFYGMENNAWDAYDINVSIEVASFGKWMNTHAEDLGEVGCLHQFYNLTQGMEDVTVWGRQLNFVNHMYVKEESPIEDIPDLEGQHLGVPPAATQTTAFTAGFVEEEYDFDLFDDPAEVTQTDSPALWSFLREDELDAALLFTGQSLSGAATDGLRKIFDTNEVWLEETGHPPSVADFSTKREWLEENPDTVIGFLNGWTDAIELAKDNPDEVIENYGRLVGVEDEAEIEVAREWIEEDVIFGPELEYSQELVEVDLEFLQIFEDFGLLEIPDDPDTLYATAEDLEDM